MSKEIKIAIVGSDTSHATELPKRMQDPACPENAKVNGLKVIHAMPFMTPFTNLEVQRQRKEYLESIGVEVMDDLEKTVQDCDGIMLEINDPSLHLEYFRKCAEFGKPVFLDKPFAESYESSLKIWEIAREKKIRLFTTSPLRYDPAFTKGISDCSFTPTSAMIWGPMGNAAAGSSLIWYGCHSFEMLEAVMGRGAAGVSVHSEPAREICVVDYRDGRHGIVELNRKAWRYGALLRDDMRNTSLISAGGDGNMFYTEVVKRIARFMQGEDILDLEDSLEVISMLDAASRSSASGKKEYVFQQKI